MFLLSCWGPLVATQNLGDFMFYYPYPYQTDQNQLDSLKVLFNTDTLSYNKKKAAFIL